MWLVTGDDNPAGGINGGGFGPANDMLTDEQQTVAVAERDRRHVHAQLKGQTTAPLAFNATAAQVDSALEALARSGPTASRSRAGRSTARRPPCTSGAATARPTSRR